MKGVIFEREELPFWQRIREVMHAKRAQLPKDNQYYRQYKLNFMLSTFKSYKPSPKGNGIQWSKEEKEAFVKLSPKEQRKMIVRKSELQSVLFPYVSVDYEPYKYSEQISDSAKRAYAKAQGLLKRHNNIDFNALDSKIQQEILQNLRLAYKERYIKAGVELAKLLLKKAQYPPEINECVKIVKDLLPEKIPEIAYMYYRLYKDYFGLGLNREEAKECYNYALECVVWEAIDEEAQREVWEHTLTKAELYLAAGIKYQSPAAFVAAASSYCPTGTPWTVDYAIIPYHACLRCSIALGNSDAIGILEQHYRLDEGDFPISMLKVNQLRAYVKKSATQKGLINGLDPYFDEKFPPEYLIDVSSFAESCVYGGTPRDLGLASAKKAGLIKDPRSKGATLESIKEYYVMMWEIIVKRFNAYSKVANPFTYGGYITHLIYSNLQYGYPSARPYIFPKEVLELEIDFNKGLEGYGKEMEQERLEKLRRMENR